MSSAWISQVRARLAPSGPARGSDATYLEHQMVADLFGDRDDRGYLYRVKSRGADVTALVVSRDRPDAPPDARPWGCFEELLTKPYELDLARGQRLDYEIRINATRTVTTDGTKRRRDVWDAAFEADPGSDQTPNDAYGAYLCRAFEGCAQVLRTRVVERGGCNARKARSRRSIFFVAANLIGTLEVTDPVQFRERVLAGVGKARAFGCGLLCLSRPGSVLPRRHPQSRL